MSVIERQINLRIEVTVSNAFNISILSKASSMATNDKTASVRDDNSDDQCPCEGIQIRFPIPDAWVYMFRVEKRFRYGAIHSVRRKAGKLKVRSLGVRLKVSGIFVRVLLRKSGNLTSASDHRLFVLTM